MKRISVFVCDEEQRRIALSVLDNVYEHQSMMNGDPRPDTLDILKQHSMLYTRHIKVKTPHPKREYLVATLSDKALFEEELTYQSDIYIEDYLSFNKVLLCCDGPCDLPGISTIEPYSLKSQLRNSGKFLVYLHLGVNVKNFTDKLSKSMIIVEEILHNDRILIETSSCSDIRPLLDTTIVKKIFPHTLH